VSYFPIVFEQITEIDTLKTYDSYRLIKVSPFFMTTKLVTEAQKEKKSFERAVKKKK
jgi:hypothetical protein